MSTPQPGWPSSPPPPPKPTVSWTAIALAVVVATTVLAVSAVALVLALGDDRDETASTTNEREGSTPTDAPAYLDAAADQMDIANALLEDFCPNSPDGEIGPYQATELMVVCNGDYVFAVVFDDPDRFEFVLQGLPCDPSRWWFAGPQWYAQVSSPTSAERFSDAGVINLDCDS